MRRAPSPRRIRYVRALAGLFALVAGLFAAVIPATPAAAHAILLRANPAAESIVEAAPGEVTLTFSESVELVGGLTKIIGPDGDKANTGEPAARGAVVTLRLPADAARGTYVVSYRVISSDSHPVSGGYRFSIGAPSENPASGTDQPRVHPVVSVALPVVRFIGFTGLVLLVGAVVALVAFWPRDADRAGPRRALWAGVGLVALAALLEVYLQVPYRQGGTPWSVGPEEVTEILGTRFGLAHGYRILILLAALPLLWRLTAAPIAKGQVFALAGLGLAGALTWPMSGHPIAAPWSAVAVAADATHLAAMSFWLGGNVMLVMFLLRTARARVLGAVLPIWSRWAAAAVTVLVMTGTLQALNEVRGFGPLFSTKYGRLILAKVALVTVIVVIALVARRVIQRSESGRLRRLVAAELAVAAVVLGVTAVLVQTTPARTAAVTVAQAPPSTVLTCPLYTLNVDLDPGRVGNNIVHLIATAPDGQPVKVLQWTVVAVGPGGVTQQLPLSRINDSHVTGQLTATEPGQWEMRYTLRLSDVDQATVFWTVPIR